MVTLVKARMKLYKKETGGRKTPFVTGYRPIFSFTNQKMKTSGQIILINKEDFKPGEEAEVKIRFLSKFLEENFQAGVRFTFEEGGEALGEGKINEILQ